jgi:hypothetical protein
MSQAETDWSVREHGPITKLASNLWWVQGTLPNMSLRRVMAVARLRDGRLVIHNGIALEEAAMRELEGWGTPAFLIVPNGFHRLDAARYKQRYPNLRVFAPSGSRAKVEQKIKVDGGYEDFPADEDVRLEMLHGVKGTEGAMIVRSEDGLSVVLNDAVMNMDRKRDPLGFLFTTLMGSAPGPRVSRLAKLTLVNDRKALRADLERFAELPELTRLIVAHEKVASGAAAREALQKAAAYL